MQPPYVYDHKINFIAIWYVCFFLFIFFFFDYNFLDDYSCYKKININISKLNKERFEQTGFTNINYTKKVTKIVLHFNWDIISMKFTNPSN